MEMHQIRYFLAVSRVLNFTQAAAECNVAQPSLTRAIKKLEDELGGDLFRRERQQTHPTELGRMMMPLLSQCYEGAVSAKGLANSYTAGERAPLSFAVSKSVEFALLAGPLSRLATALPGLTLTFCRGGADELEAVLKTGDAELGVGDSIEPGWDRLNASPLFSDRLVVALHADHPLAQGDRVDPAALRVERILGRPYSAHDAQVIERLASHGVENAAYHWMASDDELLGLLVENAGVAILPDSTRLRDGIVTRPVAGLDLERTVYLFEVAGRQRSFASSALVKLMRAADFTPTPAR